ncbi:serine hydrolase domain-containing protein [Formosa sp. PL04]|uniref:serine hydrolase domain-containing protein n=1 Tax=Formosa sp. PL04 TaxID=3081755 RepID=UPI0029824D46|nr:serine hydrolase domain-containing protein [Formosa sp. PL04]MDW5289926.1 serine hydrolase domain-containing protein [Formosa sp. PL04]
METIKFLDYNFSLKALKTKNIPQQDMKHIFLILIFTTFLLSCKQQNKVTTNKKQDISALQDSLAKHLNSVYKQDAIMGFSVAVVNENGLIYDNGFGFTDIEKKHPYTSSSIQNIASISKTLIGIALLQAQELGALNINDPINDYLPFKIVNPNYPEIPILIKHLAYHTSSITDLDEIYSKSYVLDKSEHEEDEGVFEYFNQPNTKISPLAFFQNSLSEDGIWYTEDTFLKSKPGEAREYSNIAAALCAQVIANATGKDYQSFTIDNILKPLKMTNSGWSNADIDSTKRSELFVTKTMTVAGYSLITFADGGFITSSKDLGLLLSEFIKGYKGKGTLLTAQSYKTLFEIKQFNNPDQDKIVGVFMEFRDGFFGIKENLVGHNGSDPGVMTAMYFNPKTDLGKLVLTNTDTDFNDAVWPEIESIWMALSEFETKLSTQKLSLQND